MKKMLALLLAAALLGGCGAEEKAEYEALPVDKKDVTVWAEAEHEELNVAYPNENWLWAEGLAPMTFYWHETLSDSSAPVNVQVQLMGQLEGSVDEEMLAQMKENDFGALSGVSTHVAELRSVDGEPVIYVEQTIVIDDEALDLLIEQGTLTEEAIELSGGREVFYAMPPTYSAAIYGEVDGQLCAFVGTYSEESQKEAVLAFMPNLAMTATIQEK